MLASLLVLPACAAKGGLVTSSALLSDSVPRVQPGDSVVLKVWRDSTMSGSFAVALDGRVFLPRFGSVQVAGRPIAPLQDSLRAAYAEYLRNPTIEVTVLRRIGVEGEVNEPGLYYVDLTHTLRDVVLRAGGLTPQADPKRITLLRDGRRIQAAGDVAQRVSAAALRSGDQVVVERRGWLSQVGQNPLSAMSAATGLASLIVVLIR